MPAEAPRSEETMKEGMAHPRGEASGGDARIDGAPRHTPGPWTISFRHGRAAAIWAGDYRITGEIDNNGNPVNLANARLIAAAPELLEAATDLLALIAAVAPEYSEATVTANARAAIAKALAQ